MNPGHFGMRRNANANDEGFAQQENFPDDGAGLTVDRALLFVAVGHQFAQVRDQRFAYRAGLPG